MIQKCEAKKDNLTNLPTLPYHNTMAPLPQSLRNESLPDESSTTATAANAASTSTSSLPRALSASAVLSARTIVCIVIATGK